MDKRMMLKGNAKVKPTKNYFLKDGFQKLLVAIFVQRMTTIIKKICFMS